MEISDEMADAVLAGLPAGVPLLRRHVVAALHRVAPLIAAQALREKAMNALDSRERALCVGGPKHGTEMVVESGGGVLRVVMPFVPEPYWREEFDGLDDPLRDRVRSYFQRRVYREINGVRYVRTVWLFDELSTAGDRASMVKLTDAVGALWFAGGEAR